MLSYVMFVLGRRPQQRGRFEKTLWLYFVKAFNTSEGRTVTRIMVRSGVLEPCTEAALSDS